MKKFSGKYRATFGKVSKMLWKISNIIVEVFGKLWANDETDIINILTNFKENAGFGF